jgi:hypothetical protein
MITSIFEHMQDHDRKVETKSLALVALATAILCPSAPLWLIKVVLSATLTFGVLKVIQFLLHLFG